MAYATQADLTGRFGTDELESLAPDGNGGINPAPVQQALDDASATIDSYIRPRYALPLPVQPPVLTRLACDLARNALYLGDQREPTTQVKELAAAAMVMLRDLGSGRAMLDLPDGTVPPVPVGIGIAKGRRAFPQEMLDGYEQPFAPRGLWRGFRL